jgi:hypothetical protein
MELDKIRGVYRVGYGGTFREFTIKDLTYVIDCIKSKISFDIRPSRVNITDIHAPGVAIHTDRYPAALNLYFDAAGGDDITTFYDASNSTPVNVGWDVQKYDESNLAPIGTFVANKGDCYLLNTSIPHGVTLVTPCTVRTILRFVWLENSYNEVLNSIKII